MTRLESPLRLGRNRAKDDDRPRGVWKYLILLVMISSIIIVPYGWLILRAFTNQQGEFTLSNWGFLTQETTLVRGVVLPAATQPLLNSFIFAIVMAALVVCITVPAAYAMSRTEYTGRRLMAKIVDCSGCIPLRSIVVQLYPSA